MDKIRNRSNCKSVILGMTSAVALAIAAPQSLAQQTQTTVERVAIEEQPLGDALIAIADAYGVTVLASEELVAGKTAPPVSGTMTAQDAINLLLKGSNLSASPNANGDFIVIRTVSEALERTPRAEDVIIVRGLRTERTEFETPTSISVFTKPDLDKQPGAQSLDDLLFRVPNIIDNGDNGGGVTIRGVKTSGVLRGGLAATGGARPRSSTIVDGRVQDFQEFVYGGSSIYDVEQIEVFRGPQTTTQGVNSIAGALFIFTNDPSFDFEAGVLAEVAEDDARQFAGYVSGPIVEDQLAFRLTADYRARDSFVDFDSGVPLGANPTLDGDPTEIQELVLRGKLLWRPNALPGFEGKLTLSWVENFRPTNEWVVEPFEDRRARDFSTIGRAESETLSGILDLSYDFGNGIRVSNQTTLSDYQTDLINSVLPGVFYEGDQFSNELIVRANHNDRFSSQAGLYYWSQEQQDDLLSFNAIIDDEQESLGIFGQTIWQMTDRLEMTAGLRYQQDAQIRQGSLSFGPFAADVDYDETYDAWLPKMELAYLVNDDTRIGVTASRGFNPGGLTVNFFTGLEDRFIEETVWTYDAFVRSGFFDKRLSLNGNIFFSDYEGFQKFSVIGFNPVDDSPIVEIDNVDSAQTYGIEIEADYAPNEFFSVFGNIGLLETSFDNFTGLNTLEEFEFANAPGFSMSLGASAYPIEGLRLTAQYRYSDGFFSDDDNTPALENDSRSILDFSARYDFENIGVYAFWENATDDFYTNTQFFQGPNRRAAIGAPERAGIGIEVTF
ncbi:MAG: TonB-dependent receptor [Pseudomonadota bacterium]